MRIGVFDSGLGGLVIHKAIMDCLPSYSSVYLGDTLHVPYGGRSPEAICEYSKRCIDYLFRHQDCHLIIMACNTASATALRKIQQEYLPAHYPDRRVLGVVVPTIEVATENGYQRIGLLATQYSVSSNVYAQELMKLSPTCKIFSVAAPLLVPLIEHNGLKWVKPVLQEYIQPILEEDIQALILGCTHYPVLKDMLKEILPQDITLISQDEIIPTRLKRYLKNHPEHEERLTKNADHIFLVTDFPQNYLSISSALFKKDIHLRKISI